MNIRIFMINSGNYREIKIELNKNRKNSIVCDLKKYMLKLNEFR